MSVKAHAIITAIKMPEYVANSFQEPVLVSDKIIFEGYIKVIEAFDEINTNILGDVIITKASKAEKINRRD